MNSRTLRKNPYPVSSSNKNGGIQLISGPRKVPKGGPQGALQGSSVSCQRCKKNGQKHGRTIQKLVGQHWQFSQPPASIFKHRGPKANLRRINFHCFSGHGHFIKIELPLWREHNFQGSHPPKIIPKSDSEGQRHQKMTKIASGAVSGGVFTPPGAILVDFRVPARSQN